MKWYNADEANGIVISTRIRLARNIASYPFSPKLGEAQRVAMLRDVRNAFDRYGTSMYNFIDVSSKSIEERQALVEEHIISRDFAVMPSSEKRLLVYDENGSVSVMVGEEDHLRIQAVRPGLALDEAYKSASYLDDMLSKGIEYAFNPKLGYLTCCPSNTGTGLRASCMLHLPMLTRNGYIKDVIEFCSKLGLTVRGFFGEGSKAEGELYQVSNQITMGISEEDTITRLRDAVNAIVGKEASLRKQLEEASPLIKDKLWRSYGILSCARSVSTAEFLALWSDCMLGKCTGVIDKLEKRNLVRILIECMPSHVSLSGSDIDSAEKRDVARADRIRDYLSMDIEK